MLKLKEYSYANHVKEMAIYFDAKLDEGNDASTISMNNDKAIGFISSYQIFAGLSVWIYNITFGEDFIVDLEMADYSPYYFSYNVKGSFLHKLSNEEEFVNILQNQNMIVVGGHKTSAKLIFPKNIKLKIAVIIIDIKLIENQKTRNAKRIFSKINEIFQTIPKERPFRHLGKIDDETKKYASIVCKNDEVDLVGGLLTEGAVLNMFASQIISYKRESLLIQQQSKLSNFELSKITTLGTYIIDNLETRFTIKELSTSFGLSPKKLQNGVKHLYGDTITNYVLNLRMGHAKNLLTATELNVSEVCDRIGISSKSYFSKVFKNRYGMSPKSFKDGNVA
jgi:AraC-like DNA-binding protein